MHRKHLVAALAAVALAGTALGGPAGAEDPAAKPSRTRVAKDLLSPLSLAVAADGTVFYSQNFAGSLHAKRPGKKPKTVYQATVPGTEVGAVSVDGGSLRFATTFLPEEEGRASLTSALMGFSKSGKAEARRPLAATRRSATPTATSTTASAACPRIVPRCPQEFAAATPASWSPTPTPPPRSAVRPTSPTRASTRSSSSAPRAASPRVAVLPAAAGSRSPRPRRRRIRAPGVRGRAHLLLRAGAHRRRGRPRRQALRHHPPRRSRGPEPGRPRGGLQGEPEDRQDQEGRRPACSAPPASRSARTGRCTSPSCSAAGSPRSSRAASRGATCPRPLPADVEIRSNGDIYATIQVLPGEEERPPAR